MPVTIREIACGARNMHIEAMRSAIGKTSTSGTCLYACVLLAALLKNFARCSEVIIRGGDGNKDGGYWSADGQMHGHYWVEAKVDGMWMLVDITADQFGGPELVIEDREDALQYLAGDQGTVDRHLQELGFA